MRAGEEEGVGGVEERQGMKKQHYDGVKEKRGVN